MSPLEIPEILVLILSYLPLLKNASLVNHFWYQASHSLPRHVICIHKNRRVQVSNEIVKDRILLQNWEKIYQEIKVRRTIEVDGGNLKRLLLSNHFPLIELLLPSLSRYNENRAVRILSKRIIKYGYQDQYRTLWHLFTEHFDFTREMYSYLLVTEESEILDDLQVYSYCPPEPNKELRAYREIRAGILDNNGILSMKHVQVYSKYNTQYNSGDLINCIRSKYYTTARYIASLGPLSEVKEIIFRMRTRKASYLQAFWDYIDYTPDLIKWYISLENIVIIKLLYEKGVLQYQHIPSAWEYSTLTGALYLASQGLINRSDVPDFRIIVL